MKLVIGLGNPEKQYNFTRHNFGFLLLDLYAKIHQLNFKLETKFISQIAKQDTLLFVKPQTFYNEVGQSIVKLVNYYKLNPSEDILIICDDFNLDFGQIRYRQDAAAGGNNGLKSSIKYLGTQKFSRLLLGINNPELRKQLGDSDFVLSKFSPEEQEKLPVILQNALQTLKNYIS